MFLFMRIGFLMRLFLTRKVLSKLESSKNRKSLQRIRELQTIVANLTTYVKIRFFNYLNLYLNSKLKLILITLGRFYQWFTNCHY